MKRQAQARSLLAKLPYAETRDDVEWLRTAAEKTFRRLDAPEVLADVASGVVYVNRGYSRRRISFTFLPKPRLSYLNASPPCLLTPCSAEGGPTESADGRSRSES